MTLAVFLVALGVLCAGLLLFTRPRGQGPAARPTFRPPPRKLFKTEEDVWLGKLLNLTRGNRGAIERAVTAKRRKFPRATRAELLEMVYDEYQRDHTRN